MHCSQLRLFFNFLLIIARRSLFSSPSPLRRKTNKCSPHDSAGRRLRLEYKTHCDRTVFFYFWKMSYLCFRKLYIIFLFMFGVQQVDLTLENCAQSFGGAIPRKALVEPVKGGYVVCSCALFLFMQTTYPVRVTTQTSRKAEIRRRFTPSNNPICFHSHPPD